MATKAEETATKTPAKETAKTSTKTAAKSTKPEFSYAELLEIQAQRGTMTHAKRRMINKAIQNQRKGKWGEA